MANEQLEFLISQYADGTLPEERRVELESRLADDAEARAMMADDRSLTELLRSAPLPDVQWDRLAESISGAIEQQLQERADRASWWLRHRLPTSVAIAASVFIAIGVAIHVLVPHRSHAVADRGPAKELSHQTVAMLNVQGPQEDAPSGPEVTQISIGAGGSYAKDSALAPYADEIDNRPSRVVIASGMSAVQPSVGFPY
jgi:anti-sigma factor RsiW